MCDFVTLTVPRVSSALKAVDLKQVPAPLIIGERITLRDLARRRTGSG